MHFPLPPPPAISSLAEPALFLDFDGTLVALAGHPDAIEVPPTLGAALEAMANERGGRLAIVSGRYLANLRKHLGPCAVVCVGSHGAEIDCPFGDREHSAARRLSKPVMTELSRFAEERHGLLIERKPLGAALHFRRAPERAREVKAFVDRLAKRYCLRSKEGKMVVELAATDANKGDAVRMLMRAAPYYGASPVFVGDDVTDEDGFAAAGELGGFGILVGQPRPTSAQYRLDDVAAVHRWLKL